MSKRCCAPKCYNSQVTNRSVSYFSFPKSESFAHQWAIAAGRDDLVEKTLKNLIKYFLCSEHFTDDCFTSIHKTNLKKTTRPITVPIPSKFENNIEKYVPKSATKSPNNIINKTSQSAKEYFIQNSVNIVDEETTTLTQAEEQEEVEEEEEDSTDQFQNYLIGTTTQNVEDTLQDNEENEGIIYFQKVSNIDSLDNYYLKDGEDCVDETMSILGTVDTIDEPKQLFATCRLCANEFTFDEVVSIFSTDFGIAEYLERLMPNEISPDDSLPQQICISCYSKLKDCVEVLNSFQIVQGLLKEQL